MEETNITNFEIVDSPEALQQSLESESSQETQAPVQEAVEEQPSEPAQESDYVDPEAQPTTDQPQQENTTEEYSDSDIEEAVLGYLSERLGREISNFDSLSQPQQTALDERIEAISRFVSETGRAPEDWFAYQRLNPSEMDDMTAIRVDLASEFPNLTSDEINLLVQNKYKLDQDLYSEEEVQMSRLQMKIDSQKAKASIETMRQQYMAPENQDTSKEVYSEDWIRQMKAEVNEIDGLEFNLGGDKTFTFGFDADYKNQLVQKNSSLDGFFDNYVRNDGSWDFDMLSSHMALLDNIDTIVQSVYRQGMSDGQRGIVDKAANVQTQSPQAGQNQTTNDPVIDQLKQIMGDGGRMTFNI